ncbi:prepilin-type N-terminal cleavage/methylation domain-containing protein [Vibrio sp. PP-XX7]
MKPNQGFTLLEILLVLVILSLGSMVAVMSLPDHSQEQVQRSAERVFQSMQLLSDEAIFSGRNYGLYVDENKHKLNFLMLTDQGWQPLESSTLKQVVPVDEGVDFRFELGEVFGTIRIAFSSQVHCLKIWILARQRRNGFIHRK